MAEIAITCIFTEPPVYAGGSFFRNMTISYRRNIMIVGGNRNGYTCTLFGAREKEIIGCWL